MNKQERNDCRANRLLAGLLVLASCVQSHAQSRNQSAPAELIRQTGPTVISCPVDVITVEVKVTDPRGREASSLGRDDFLIYDNGVEHQVRLWAKLEGSGKGDEEAVYALAYTPVNLYDGKSHMIRVVARGKNRRKLKAKLLSPEVYDAKEYLRSLESTPPNIGMQRTRTRHASYHQRLVRAADARRSTSSLL